MFVKRCILICLISLMAAATQAQVPKFRFDHLTLQDGLPSNRMLAIEEDRFGFYWMGSLNGLSLYNGYDLKTYFADQQDSTTLSGNEVWAILEDEKHNLWIGTDNGLDRYDRVNDRFIRYFEKPGFESFKGSYVTVIREYLEHQLFIGTDRGLLIYDYQTDSLRHFELKSKSNYIRCIYQSDDEKYLVGTLMGIYALDLNAGTMKPFSLSNQPPGLHERVITDIESDSAGNLWIGTFRQGLYYFNAVDSTFVNFSEERDMPNALSDDMVYDVLIDKKGRTWVATDNGLNLSMTDGQKDIYFEQILNTTEDPYGLTSNIITCMYEDGKGWLWFGTMRYGFNILPEGKYLFEHYKYYPATNRSPSGAHIASFTEDDKGNIWMGVDGSGLNKFNVDTKTFEYFRKDPVDNYGLENEKVITVKFDTNNTFIWGGTWGSGIFKYNPRTKRFVHFKRQDGRNSLSWNYILRLMVDSRDNVWLGTHGNGLDKYDPETGKFTNYKVISREPDMIYSNTIMTLFEDQSGNIWVGSQNDGMFLYDPKVDLLTSEHIISDIIPDNFRRIRIIEMRQDSDGDFWIATSAGLYFISTTSHQYKLITKEDGLASNSLNGIVCHENTVWVANEMGISSVKYNKSNDELDFTIISYGEEEGVQSLQFVPNSTYMSSTGEIYMGGVNGFNVFHPDSIKPIVESIKLYFTGLKLFNDPVNIGDSTGILDSAMILKNKITLEYDQNAFTIDYFGMNYVAPEKVRYQYKLEGYDRDWVSAGTRRSANYTNLNPGQYTFLLRATNVDSYWPEEHIELDIKIVHAPWQTFYFKAGASFILALLLLGIYYYRVNSIRKQKIRLEQIVEKRTEELKRTLKMVKEQSEEIQAQNEELTSQNMEISAQRDQIESINQTLEDRVRERTRNLVKANQELDKFVYSASHDLSAPLKSILGLIRVARYEDADRKLTEHFDFMENSVHKLEEVIDNLTQFSRNAGKEVRYELVYFDAIVNEVLSDLKSDIDESRIKVIKKYPVEKTLYTDKFRLKIILSNLLANAIKYRDLDKTNPEVQIKVEEYEHGFKFIVTDNGIGIDEHHIDQVFEMFYRATTKSSGSGLGLYIVKEMVQKLGGEVGIQSEPGTGTSFRINLNHQT